MNTQTIDLSCEWYTPKSIFDALGLRFDLNAASPVAAPQPVKVCDHCRTVCCQSRYCSGRCARQAVEWARYRRETIKDERTATR